MSGMRLDRNICEGREGCKGAMWEELEWVRLVNHGREYMWQAIENQGSFQAPLPFHFSGWPTQKSSKTKLEEHLELHKGVPKLWRYIPDP